MARSRARRTASLQVLRRGLPRIPVARVATPSPVHEVTVNAQDMRTRLQAIGGALRCSWRQGCWTATLRKKDGERVAAAGDDLVEVLDTVLLRAEGGRQPTIIVARCPFCDERYTTAGWALLDLVGYQVDQEANLEQRNCPCGNTLSVEVATVKP